MKDNLDAYRYLDNLALQAGTDKASSTHNYTLAYAQHFEPIKDDPIKFLEIGIYEGNSVKLWENYFKNAELHFIDRSFESIKYESPRSHYHLACQENRQDLNRFITESGGNFDVIIDDGGHRMEQQIISFEHLFPHLNSNGIYVIEDLHTSYWSCLGGGNHGQTTIAVLKHLIDKVNYASAFINHSRNDKDPIKTFNNIDSSIVSGNFLSSANRELISDLVKSKLDIYQKEILSICFHSGIVFIKKR
jgi:hypothetical protein